MYIVLVKFAISAGNVEAFLNRVKQQARDSLEKETDCHIFDVCIDLTNEHRIMLYEIYTDSAAFDTHLQSEHFKAFDAEVKDMITDKTVEFYNGT